LRESGKIACQETETLLAAHRSRGDASVQPQKISDRACVVRTASRTYRSHVLDEREQVSARRRRNRNVKDRREQVRQQWIKEEVGELAIVLRIGDAEQVFGTGSNDQFVDQ
jgi:hypothetical protein